VSKIDIIGNNTPLNPLSRGDLNTWNSPLERGFRGV